MLNIIVSHRRVPATFPALASEDSSDIRVVSSDADDVTPQPSDAEEDIADDVAALQRAERKARKSERRRRRAESSREEEAAFALLRMHEVSAEEKERHMRAQQERNERIAAMRQDVEREHNYLYKGDPKRRPRDPIPNYPEHETDVTDSASEGEPDMIPCLPASLTSDHQYCLLYHEIDVAEQFARLRSKLMGRTARVEDYYAESEPVCVNEIAMDIDVNTAPAVPGKRPYRRQPKQQTSHLKGSRELMAILPSVDKPKPKFKARSRQEQLTLTYDFLVKGIDQEDVNFLKRRYEELLQDDSRQTAWLNNVHWVDHCPTDVPDPPAKKRRRAEEELRKHTSGCARTEGHYSISHAQKKTYLRHAVGVTAYNNDSVVS